MKKVLSLALGVFTAIGGFIDIGDLITDALIGARFGLALVWVTVVAVIGVALYSEMAGRVAVVTGRTVFDLIRERMGPAPAWSPSSSPISSTRSPSSRNSAASPWPSNF
jgi:Mn2+/Fe2+ NRAMP family transporter